MPVLKPESAQISRAAQQLIDGSLVAFPTETVYGLGGDASSAQATAAIYQSKQRPPDHPLIVHVSTIEMAQWWADVGAIARQLATRFWPGPLTLILNRREQAPDFACGGQSTIGLRSPSHPIARSLMLAFESLGGRGIAAPSANRFGRISPTTADHVIAELGDDLNVLDGGNCSIGLESTIVDLSRGAPMVLRPGAITSQQIHAALSASPAGTENQSADESLASENQTTPTPRVSGTLAAHYAPSHRLLLAEPQALPSVVEKLLAEGCRLAVCSRRRPGDAPLHWELASNDAAQFGHRLYAMLREFDALPIDAIVIERVPNDPAWLAVNDRLIRSATGSVFESSKKSATGHGRDEVAD